MQETLFNGKSVIIIIQVDFTSTIPNKLSLKKYKCIYRKEGHICGTVIMRTVTIAGINWIEVKQINEASMLVSSSTICSGYFDTSKNEYEGSVLQDILNNKILAVLKERGLRSEHVLNGIWPLTEGQYNLYVKNTLPSLNESWLLKNAGGTPNTVLCVKEDGSVSEIGVNESCGIRVAMIVNTSYLDEILGKNESNNKNIQEDGEESHDHEAKLNTDKTADVATKEVNTSSAGEQKGPEVYESDNVTVNQVQQQNENLESNDDVNIAKTADDNAVYDTDEMVEIILPGMKVSPNLQTTTDSDNAAKTVLPNKEIAVEASPVDIQKLNADQSTNGAEPNTVTNAIKTDDGNSANTIADAHVSEDEGSIEYEEIVLPGSKKSANNQHTVNTVQNVVATKNKLETVAMNPNREQFDNIPTNSPEKDVSYREINMAEDDVVILPGSKPALEMDVDVENMWTDVEVPTKKHQQEVVADAKNKIIPDNQYTDIRKGLKDALALANGIATNKNMQNGADDTGKTLEKTLDAIAGHDNNTDIENEEDGTPTDITKTEHKKVGHLKIELANKNEPTLESFGDGSNGDSSEGTLDVDIDVAAESLESEIKTQKMVEVNEEHDVLVDRGDETDSVGLYITNDDACVECDIDIDDTLISNNEIKRDESSQLKKKKRRRSKKRRKNNTSQRRNNLENDEDGGGVTVIDAVDTYKEYPDVNIEDDADDDLDNDEYIDEVVDEILEDVNEIEKEKNEYTSNLQRMIDEIRAKLLSLQEYDD